MDKLKMHSPDLSEKNIEKIKKLFPNCVTEAKKKDGKLEFKVDFDQLKQELSGFVVDGQHERFHLNWPGKREAILTANAPIAKTLRPNKNESIDFDSTKNVLIEGDNLDALKLLQETYLGRIKMIYIDPPYNTGKDFIYEDNFSDTTENFLIKSNQSDNEGNRLVSNTEANGKFHSDWLSMIYPRLKIARNLLSDDGVIFISIDENEFHNLKAIGLEIFGEPNFITSFCWEKKKKPSFLNKNLGSKFEYILCFAKDREYTKAFSVDKTEEGKKYPFNNAGNSISTLKFPVGSVKFNLPDQTIPAQDMSEGKILTTLLNDLVIENRTNKSEFELRGEWRYSQAKLDEIIKNKEEIIISKVPFRPNHVKAGGEVKKMHNLLTIKHFEIETNEDADTQLTQLFGRSYFDYAKPVGLIKTLIQALMYDDQEGIVLDFFAGSGTTAEAVMKLNAEDGGSRRFILVQLPEAIPKDNIAYKDGFKSISEITKKRVVEARKNYAANDTGMRVFKIDSSNMDDNFYAPNDIAQSTLNLLIDHIKSDRTEEDLLFQVLLDWGLDLSLSIKKETFGDSNIFLVEDDLLAACFSTRITEEIVKKLATLKPLRVVFRDDGFATDALKINAVQIFRQLSPHTDVKTV